MRWASEILVDKDHQMGDPIKSSKYYSHILGPQETKPNHTYELERFSKSKKRK